jgi:glutamate-1-semialdehyde 2,1-aminomutase
VKTALAEAAKRAGFRAQVAGEAPVFEIYFTDRPITDYRATLTADRALHAAFSRALLEQGVVKAAQKIYVSLAHTEEDIRRTVQSFTAAFQAVADQRS